jgi:hypothetical protein
MKSELVSKIHDGPDHEIRMSIIVTGDHYDALIEIFRSTALGPARIQGVRISSRRLNEVVKFIRQVRKWNPANDR